MSVTEVNSPVTNEATPAPTSVVVPELCPGRPCQNGGTCFEALGFGVCLCTEGMKYYVQVVPLICLSKETRMSLVFR